MDNVYFSELYSKEVGPDKSRRKSLRKSQKPSRYGIDLEDPNAEEESIFI